MQVELENFLPAVLLTIVTIAEIGFFVYFLRYQKTITIQAFLALIAGVILWVASNAFSFFLGNGDVTFPQKFAYIGGTIIPFAFLVFVYSFPYPIYKSVFFLKKIAIGAVLVFTSLFLFTESFHAEMKNGIIPTTKQGVILWTWAALFLIVWLAGAIELFRRYFRSSGETHLRLRYLLYGVVISSVVGILTDVIFPVTMTVHYAWLGPAASLVWLGFSIKAVRV